MIRYSDIYTGKFIDRPNRFIAHVEINGNVETVHVKNTGRCREVLIPGVNVSVQHFDKPGRKNKMGPYRGRKGKSWLDKY